MDVSQTLTNIDKMLTEDKCYINGSTLKTKKLYRIKFRGIYIKTKKGKTLWTGIGPAKLAFRNLIHSVVIGDLYKAFDSRVTRRYPSHQEKDDYFKAIMNSGQVEFVEQDKE